MTGLPRALLLPWVSRLRRGDGGLLLFPLAYLALAGTPFPRWAAWSLALAAAMILLYAVNDVRDAADDRANPRKDPRVVGLVEQHQRALRAVLAAAHVAYPAAVALVSPVAAIKLAALLAVNLAYSLGAKRVPLLDIAVVGVWGGLLVALPDTPLPLVLAAAWMTAISHMFQMREDQDADRAAAVRTTSVAYPRLARLLTTLLSLGLAAGAAWRGYGLVAALALGPAVADRLPIGPAAAWQAARVTLAGAWLLLAVDLARQGA